MKFTMFITEDAAQVNLTPENDHEREYINVLMKYEGGSVAIHHGVDISECKGGYIRDFGRGGNTGNTVAIILKAPRTRIEDPCSPHR